MDCLKVSSKSSPASVAGAIAGMVKDGVPVNIQCVGAGAVNQAIKAVAIARGFLIPTGFDISCAPVFSDILINGESRTAIRLSIYVHQINRAAMDNVVMDDVKHMDQRSVRDILAGKTYFIRTFGCQMNQHDSERVSGLLDSYGCLMALDPEHADIVVFMTCCVREAADTRLYGQCNSCKSLPPSPSGKRVVAVGGCIAQRDGEGLLTNVDNVNVIFGTHSIASCRTCAVAKRAAPSRRLSTR